MSITAMKLAVEFLEAEFARTQDALIDALRTAISEAERVEPYGNVTVRRLSQRFENHVDQYQFYPAGEYPYLDNADECHAVYLAPQTAPKQELVVWVGEIDELRAALAERDAEIERLKTVPMKYRRMAFNAELQEEVATQRKVLEQALEALQQLLPRGGHEGGVAVWRLGASHAVTEAITAIQEQLK